MSAEIHYSRVEMSGNKGPMKPQERSIGVVSQLRKGPEELIPESFLAAVAAEKPNSLDWDRVDGAVAVLKGEKEAVTPKPSEEVTESQKFWRDMYRTGKLSPYQKDRPKVEWSAFGEAVRKTIIEPKNVSQNIMDLDMKLRGGADKEYNQLGPMSVRARRMAVMAGNTVPFVAFDIGTSIPAELVIEFAKLRQGEHSQFEKGVFSGLSKMMAVQNDKVVTALGDMLVTKLTGEKGAWTHEAGDKSADLLQTAADDYLEDTINGPVIESAMRFIFQIPVVGALVEQGWTRLSLLQEKSQLHKGIAKSIYMGIGLGIGVYREVNNTELHPKRSPSAMISKEIWKFFVPPQKKNPIQFFDTGK